MFSILFLLAFSHHEDVVGGRVGNNLSVRVDMGKRFLIKTQVVADPVLTLPTCISPSVRLPKSPPIDHSFGSACVLYWKFKYVMEVNELSVPRT